jgi:hypothetical protein
MLTNQRLGSQHLGFLHLLPEVAEEHPVDLLLDALK